MTETIRYLTEDEARADYDADVARRPNYSTGTPRDPWEHLPELAKSSWRRARRFTSELTECGEQYVVPGCEKHERPAGSQLKLWEA